MRKKQHFFFLLFIFYILTVEIDEGKVKIV